MTAQITNQDNKKKDLNPVVAINTENTLPGKTIMYIKRDQRPGSEARS